MTVTNRAGQPGSDPGQDVPSGTYTIDPARSVIRFDTRAVFGLLPVRGTFRIGSGTITVATPVEESTAEAEVLAGSFDSGLGPGTPTSARPTTWTRPLTPVCASGASGSYRPVTVGPCTGS
ncbi:YceI family protein [Plantactinospora veratri]